MKIRVRTGAHSDQKEKENIIEVFSEDELLEIIKDEYVLCDDIRSVGFDDCSVVKDGFRHIVYFYYTEPHTGETTKCVYGWSDVNYF